MPSIIIKDTEHFDIVRKKEFYEKPTEMRKRKMAAAKKRARKTNRINNFGRQRSYR